VLAVRLVAVAVAFALSGISLASPPHVHEVEEHGHHELIVHRHFQTHAAVAINHHQPAVDHPDDLIATVDQDYTVPPSLQLTAPDVVPVATLVVPSSPTRIGHVEFVERLIHGPPRAPASPRGPPSSCLA